MTIRPNVLALLAIAAAHLAAAALCLASRGHCRLSFALLRLDKLTANLTASQTTGLSRGQ